MKRNIYIIESHIIDDSSAVACKVYKSKRQAKKDGIKEAYNIKEMRYIKL